jgi:hypothetical protein
MRKNKIWERKAKETITNTKRFLANLSIKVRTDQYRFFLKNLKPDSKSTVLDVGVTSDETLKDSNLFERLFKWPENLTAATIEDTKKFKKLYPHIAVKKIYPGRKLQYADQEFDISVSWATLEHVGGYKEQEKFLNELLRVGKKLFVTTPYRGAIYEPHSGFFFLHWLPLSLFRKICSITGRDFWSTSDNLNPLYARDFKEMELSKNVNIKIYKMFYIIPSHLIIYS